MLCCVAVALAAALWGLARGRSQGGAGRTADADGDADAVVETLRDIDAAESSADRFLEDLARGEEAGGAAAVTWVGADGLVAAAGDVLAAYEESSAVRGATVATSGYLDLKGHAWGAIVRGATWVDVVTIAVEEEGADGMETCRARIVRLWPGYGGDLDGGLS